MVGSILRFRTWVPVTGCLRPRNLVGLWNDVAAGARALFLLGGRDGTAAGVWLGAGRSVRRRLLIDVRARGTLTPRTFLGRWARVALGLRGRGVFRVSSLALFDGLARGDGLGPGSCRGGARRLRFGTGRRIGVLPGQEQSQEAGEGGTAVAVSGGECVRPGRLAGGRVVRLAVVWPVGGVGRWVHACSLVRRPVRTSGSAYPGSPASATSSLRPQRSIPPAASGG